MMYLELKYNVALILFGRNRIKSIKKRLHVLSISLIFLPEGVPSKMQNVEKSAMNSLTLS